MNILTISSAHAQKCPFDSTIRHDIVAKTILKAIILRENPDDKFSHQRDLEHIYKVNNTDYWWNIPLQTAIKVPHNKPDIVILDQEKKNVHNL